MPNYYVVGSMNNWTESSAYELIQDSVDTNKFVLTNVGLSANDKLKVKSSENNWYTDASTWTDCGFYLDGDGNVCLYNSGDYNIVFYLSSGSNNHIVLETYTPPVVQLTAPVISILDKTISWSAVEHATGYKVFISGAGDAISINTTSYTLTLTEPGTYTITVTATSTDSSYTESEKSNAVSYTVENPGPTPGTVSVSAFNRITLEDHDEYYKVLIGSLSFNIEKDTSEVA